MQNDFEDCISGDIVETLIKSLATYIPYIQAEYHWISDATKWVTEDVNVSVVDSIGGPPPDQTTIHVSISEIQKCVSMKSFQIIEFSGWF